MDAVRSRRELVLENAVLRHQVNVLRRHSKRPKLDLVDRLKLLLGASGERPSDHDASTGGGWYACASAKDAQAAREPGEADADADDGGFAPPIALLPSEDRLT